MRCCLLFGALLLTVAQYGAADVVYNYTGNPFTTFNNGPVPGAFSCNNGVGECRLSGILVFSDYLPANYSGFSPPTFVGGSFTDGVHTQNGLFFGLNFELNIGTDNLGRIDQVSILIEDMCLAVVNDVCQVGGFLSSAAGDTTDFFYHNPDAEVFATTSEPGTWTVSPEPSSIVFLLGVIGWLALSSSATVRGRFSGRSRRAFPCLASRRT